ncbi:MAG TPA: transposase [Aggregatilineaceae bacterium]|nr:transposase [Aggregatilineaceae bacterium]
MGIFLPGVPSLIMPDHPEIHHRRSIRLQPYDYAQAGAYFVTICTVGRACWLGEVVGGEMRLSALGQIVEREWLRTPTICPQVELDAYVIMPNHFHAVLLLTDVGAYCNTPLQHAPDTTQSLQSPSQTLGAIIRGFKGATTKQINLLRQTPGASFWQRNYYEHIIRDEHDLAEIRRYIEFNPGCWADDAENPARQGAI